MNKPRAAPLPAIADCCRMVIAVVIITMMLVGVPDPIK
jgi:hypothetical protein